MSEDEIYELLASDGMLIKRPLFISDKKIQGLLDVRSELQREFN